MKIALVVTPFSDENLQIAAQLGVEEIVHYDMNGMPASIQEFLAIR
jgi:hypothetical protein